MTPAETSPRRIHLLSAVVVLGSFLAGAVAGVGFYRWATPHGPPPRERSALPPHFRDLGLTPEQEARAAAILERHRPEIDAVMRETYPRMQAIVERTHNELKEILTPAQRARFEEIERRRPPGFVPSHPGGNGFPPPEPPPPSGLPGAPPPGPPP
ncbi:MAG TPA: periplasmic heavy metal sensor [Anaeromyxobacteraceae bacterium]|nr:periplasmic heavy metal sensor [Anaeromyxobacteraceae bacterium]